MKSWNRPKVKALGSIAEITKGTNPCSGPAAGTTKTGGVSDDTGLNLQWYCSSDAEF
jgi:hypothetical protein